jgi:hypothetical protein
LPGDPYRCWRPTGSIDCGVHRKVVSAGSLSREIQGCHFDER